MFWTVAGFAQSSPVEAILDKGSYTLDDLLDEDDLIQECKSMNSRLIGFLRERSTVEQLVRFITEPANEDNDPKRQFKYPFAACEIFCCEVDNIFSTLVEDEDLLRLFFSILDHEKPLDCMLAGYFARVLNSLLVRKTQDLMEYLKTHADLLSKLINHMETTSIAEILIRILGADEQTRVFLHSSNLQWLVDTPVLELLLDRLKSDYPPDVQRSAADVLTAIAETQLSPLARNLAKIEVMDALFERAFAVDGTALVPALNVCIALVEPKTAARDSVPASSIEFLTPQLEVKMKTEAVFGLSQNVKRLVSFLNNPNGEAQDTPYGSLRPALGSSRLKVVELLATLARTGMKPAEQALISANAVAKCQQLFVDYPFNNLLHRHISGLLSTIIESGSDDLVQHLFKQCNLVGWMATLPQQISPDTIATTSATQVTKQWRAGYLGYITQFGKKLSLLAEKSSRLKQLLESDKSWTGFTTSYLQPQTQLENVDQWSCGRPNALDMGGPESDQEDFDADLDLDPSDGPGLSGPRYRYGDFQGASLTQDAETSEEDKLFHDDAAAEQSRTAETASSSEKSNSDLSAANQVMAHAIDDDVLVLTGDDLLDYSPGSSPQKNKEDGQPDMPSNEETASSEGSAKDEEFGFKFWRQRLEVDIEGV